MICSVCGKETENPVLCLSFFHLPTCQECCAKCAETEPFRCDVIYKEESDSDVVE